MRRTYFRSHHWSFAIGAIIFASCSVAVRGAEDINIPVDGGFLLIKDAQFIRPVADVYLPELSFAIENHSSSYWSPLKLQFEGMPGRS